MRPSSVPLLFVLFGLFLLWGAGSWMIAKGAKNHFDLAVAAIATGRTKDFFELEVLDYQESLYGASAKIKLIPTSALIDEDIENWQFLLKRINGPLFINRQGLQLGLARWQLSMQESDSEISDGLVQALQLASSAKPIASAVVDFSERASLSYSGSALSSPNLMIDKLMIDGNIDFNNARHELTIQASGLSYSNKQFLMRFPDVAVDSKRGHARPEYSSKANVTELTVVADDGELILSGQSKKIPFNLQSHGSLWVNNDTLSSDWQIDAVSGQLLQAGGASVNGESDYFQTDLNLQFRELLISGFWQYLNNQSEIYSLFQQAEWALEEVETPEQQDFLRSLYLDADRIERTQRGNPLKPLLIAERSQLAATARLRLGNEGEASQLSIAGSTKGKIDEPELTLKGDVNIEREMLSARGVALLDKWNKKRWFRRYETEFESDITVRNGRLQLNKIIVSADGLIAELSQAIADQ